MASTAALSCGWILACAHCWHSLHQVLTPDEQPARMNRLVSMRLVACILGWARLCTLLKTCHRMLTGTRGLSTPRELSHQIFCPLMSKSWAVSLAHSYCVSWQLS